VLGEIAPKPDTLDRTLRFEYIPSELAAVVERFCAERLMWGSDFPPCSSREGYGNTIRGLRGLTDLGDEQLEWILGRTAASVLEL